MQLKALILAVLTLETGGAASAQMLGPDLGRGQNFVFNAGGASGG